MEHGGSIEIESRPGEGTTAIVDLPLAGVPEAVGRVAP
jgi:signal transduction histidine kinase